MPRSLPRSAVALACTSIATACASTPSASSVAAMCRSHLPPGDSPLSEVIDSASLAAELSTGWEAPRGLTVATVAYGATGTMDSITVVSAGMPQATKERIAGALRTRATSGQAGGIVELFLGDSTGFAPRRVRALLRCAPQLTNYRDVNDALFREVRSLLRRGSLDGDAVMATLWLSIADDGQVLETRIVRSSGRLDVDEAAVRAIGAGIFEPAKVEGIAVPGWAELPMRIRVVEPDPGPPPPPPPMPTVPRR